MDFACRLTPRGQQVARSHLRGAGDVSDDQYH
jgi:hypothetical protein